MPSNLWMICSCTQPDDNLRSIKVLYSPRAPHLSRNVNAMKAVYAQVWKRSFASWGKLKTVSSELWQLKMKTWDASSTSLRQPGCVECKFRLKWCTPRFLLRSGQFHPIHWNLRWPWEQVCFFHPNAPKRHSKVSNVKFLGEFAWIRWNKLPRWKWILRWTLELDQTTPGWKWFQWRFVICWFYKHHFQETFKSWCFLRVQACSCFQPQKSAEWWVSRC